MHFTCLLAYNNRPGKAEERDDDPAEPMEVIEYQGEDELHRFIITMTITLFVTSPGLLAI